MLTEDQLQLLTAAVDGELTPLEVRRLRRLLETSLEARELHAQLLSDSGKLQALPTVQPPADLQTRVMAKIAALTPAPVRLPQPRKVPEQQSEPATLPFAPKSRRWVPVAIAASLLLSVTLGSFMFFNRQNQPSLAKNRNQPPAATKSGAGDPEWAKWLPAESGPRPSVPTPSDRQPLPRDTVVVRNPPEPDVFPIPPDEVAIAPEPRSARPDFFGHRPLPETRFDVVEIRLPFLKPISGLNREDVQQQLIEELRIDPAYRLDVFVRNPVKAIEAMQAAAKAEGVNLLVDANTIAQLQKRNPNAPANSVAIYVECLTPTELAALFAKLPAEDAKFSPRVFDMLHAAPISDDDGKSLRSMLGIDPGLYKRPAGERGDKPTDPTKHIASGTADQIVKSVSTGQGKPFEKVAIGMTWSPTTARTLPANSAELKQFVSKRAERKPNVVPVIIVIRTGNG